MGNFNFNSKKSKIKKTGCAQIRDNTRDSASEFTGQNLI